MSARDELSRLLISIRGDRSQAEAATITVPAGATYYIYINYFASVGFTSTPYRVRVSGLP